MKGLNTHFKNTLLGIFSGVSVFYFLYFLDSFSIQKGISYSGHSHFFRAASFGSLTFLYLYFFEVYLKPRIKFDSITKKVLWYVFSVFVGSQLTYLLFNFFWNWQELYLESYLLIQKEFPLMMIFPITLYLLMNQVINQKPKEDTTILFCSENKKNQLKIKLSDFLFANAAENYVLITYLLKDQKKEHLIRKPLKKLDNELKNYTNIKRVHRSYLVNTDSISSIVQKKGKLILLLHSFEIPVSKKFQDLFLE